MKAEDIVKEIVERMGTWNDLTAYERVLIQYVVETTLGLVKK
jgi:hypothetical protein